MSALAIEINDAGLVVADDASVRAIDLGRQTFHRDIGLVHRPERTLGEPARRLLQLIRAAYA